MSIRFSLIKKRIILLIVPLLLLAFQSISFAQAGSIEGHIVDKNSKESLAGANIFLKGTSVGTASDLDGNYIIRDVPAGHYTIIVSYIGYNSDSTTIDIINNRTLQLNFSLLPQAIQGQAVTITAQALGQVAAIQQQLTANKIETVVSQARIQELPDFNAAQALSRLPGISTLQSSGEANKIVIRGLAPQYNAIDIEGIRLASTGSTQIGVTSQAANTPGVINSNQSVDLSMITPYMLKTIQVYLALTPDLNADALGGTVNFELREAPSGLHSDILWQSGYTQKSNTYNNYRTIVSGSDRFFNDKLGVYGLFNAESYNRDADNMSGSYAITQHAIGSNGYEPVIVTGVTLDRHIETRKRYGANLILDYKLPSGSIEALNMFSRLKSDYQDYQTMLDYQNKNLNFNYGSGNKTTDLAINSLSLKNDFKIMQMELKVANTYSFNNLPYSPLLQFTQTGGIVGSVPVNTIPNDLTHLVDYKGTSDTYLTNLNLFSSTYKENDQDYKADFKFPITYKSISGYFKVGGEYRYEHHENSQNTPYITLTAGDQFQINLMDSLESRFGINYASIGRFDATGFTSTNPNLTNTFLNNQFGRLYWAVNPSVPVGMINYLDNNSMFAGRAQGTLTGGWMDGLYQQLPNDYVYSQNYSAGYMMGDFKFLDFMVVGGVRYEKLTSDFSAFNLVDSRNPTYQPYFPITVHPHNSFWFPDVQIKYSPNDWMDVRYAYTQSLARPAYSELSPHFYMDYTLTNVWAGNPDLKPAHSYNHDLIFTFHNNMLGLLSIDGFYKTIKDFTYYTQYRLHENGIPGRIDSVGSFTPQPKVGAELYTYINSPYLAYVKGIEVNFQTRFWYLPFPFNGIVLGFNYTHIASKATYPFRDDITRVNPNPPPRVLVSTLDSTRTGRLIDQPNDIANLSFGYDYQGFAGRISFVFQGNSVSNIGAFPEQDGFTKNYFRIDLSARQKLPWPGFEVFLDATNLNNVNNISAQKSIGGFTIQQNYGLVADLGVRYTL